jgi:hypothetical protein
MHLLGGSWIRLSRGTGLKPGTLSSMVLATWVSEKRLSHDRDGELP